MQLNYLAKALFTFRALNESQSRFPFRFLYNFRNFYRINYYILCHFELKSIFVFNAKCFGENMTYSYFLPTSKVHIEMALFLCTLWCLIRNANLRKFVASDARFSWRRRQRFSPEISTVLNFTFSTSSQTEHSNKRGNNTYWTTGAICVYSTAVLSFYV